MSRPRPGEPGFVDERSSPRDRREEVNIGLVEYRISGIEKSLNEHLTECAVQYKQTDQKLGLLNEAQQKITVDVALLKEGIAENGRKTDQKHADNTKRLDKQDAALARITQLIIGTLVSVVAALLSAIGWLLTHPAGLASLTH